MFTDTESFPQLEIDNNSSAMDKDKTQFILQKEVLTDIRPNFSTRLVHSKAPKVPLWLTLFTILTQTDVFLIFSHQFL